jgi:hypothetical protein
MRRPRISALLCSVLALLSAACRFGYEQLPAGELGADGGVGSAEGDGDPGSDSEQKSSDDADGESDSQNPGEASPDDGEEFARCAPDSDCRCATFAERSYRACLGPLNYAAAAAACEAHGMKLARVDDDTENSALNQLMTSALPANLFAFLGASDEASEGSWRWLDGDTEFWIGAADGTAVGGAYANWDENKPFGNKTRNCAGMLVPGTWEDRSCTAENAYLCEGP